MTKQASASGRHTIKFAAHVAMLTIAAAASLCLIYVVGSFLDRETSRLSFAHEWAFWGSIVASWALGGVAIVTCRESLSQASGFDSKLRMRWIYASVGFLLLQLIAIAFAVDRIRYLVGGAAHLSAFAVFASLGFVLAVLGLLRGVTAGQPS